MKSFYLKIVTNFNKIPFQSITILQPFIPHPSKLINQIIPQEGFQYFLFLLLLSIYIKFTLFSQRLYLNLAATKFMSWQSDHGIVPCWLFRDAADILCHSSFANVCVDFIYVVSMGLFKLDVLFSELWEGDVCFCWFYVQYVLFNLCFLVKVVVFKFHHWGIEWVDYFFLDSWLAFFIVLWTLLLLFVLCQRSLFLFLYVIFLLLSIQPLEKCWLCYLWQFV